MALLKIVLQAQSLFADDSSAWRSGIIPVSIDKVLNEDLITIEKWCRRWGFVINSENTTAKLFTRTVNFK